MQMFLNCKDFYTVNKAMNDSIIKKVANATNVDAATIKTIAEKLKSHEAEAAGFRKAVDDVFFLASELKGSLRSFPVDKYGEALTHLTSAREALTSTTALYEQANQQ